MSTVPVPNHVRQFVADIEETYGRYPPKLKIGVLEVLKVAGYWPSQEWLDRLYDAVTDTFSPKWGKVPSKIEIRAAIQVMAPEPYKTIQSRSDAQQITDDAGAIPLEVGLEYVSDILGAFRRGEIRPDDIPDDGRPTAYEYEQAWKERRGIA